ncbi:hypothetical protein [Xanthomonas sp. MUS 060]|uniref:hypothetical protein n=1 Tax=Xanthomonas sp. MUS 060 TaxID=1588031 RepID=UPI0005F2E151|nr:hypothetical protein [Xanthomonas sp. MUS 060]
MNKTETQRMIEVMQAYIDGKQIECGDVGSCSVWTTISDPLWDWGCCDYRVKQEPRVIYVNEYSDGSIAPHDNMVSADCMCIHETAEEARRGANDKVLRVAVKYREVIE